MKVFVTRPVFDEAIDRLRRVFEVELNTEERILPKQELIAHLRDKDGALTLLTDAIDLEVLESTPRLKVIANFAVGFNNVAVDSATKLGVVVTNTPGVLTETTADFAWTLLMAVARRLSEGEALARSGNWKHWDLDQLVGTDVWGKTLGIVGFGRIGRAVARRASGFQMKVIYTDAQRVPAEVESAMSAEFREMDALLAESDFVSVHVPLLPETRGLFDAAKFYRMKPTAFLINTSRGPVVDEAALVAALETGKIAGAGLDVYENEPFIHPGLKRANVVLAPHIASASLETRTKMACIAAENVVALFTGQRPANVLNPEVLKTS